MKTTKEMAEIMLAAAAGKKVLWRSQFAASMGGAWVECIRPSWNWAEHDYMIAPEPALAPPKSSAMKVELHRHEKSSIMPFHGGPAVGVTWELTVNGVVVAHEYARYLWEYDPAKRAMVGAKPPAAMQELYDKLVATIPTEEEAKP